MKQDSHSSRASQARYLATNIIVLSLLTTLQPCELNCQALQTPNPGNATRVGTMPETGASPLSLKRAQPITVGQLPRENMLPNSRQVGMIDFQGPLAPSKSTSTIIGSGDLLAIAVFDVPELSGTFRVGDDGFISLPLIGPLKVDGKLTVQLESQLADAFRYRKLIVDPQVSIQIIEFVAQGVTVGGEVVRPGVYPALGSHKLADLIAAAGGTTPMAGWIATVNHRRGGKTEDVAILSSDGRAAGGEVDLSSGDTVTVQRAGIVYVLGDVGRPGGFTIDRETVSVTQAVALAQGFTRSSSLNKARILSSKDGAFTEFSFDLRNILNGKSRDLSLRNGDVLYIPQSGAKALFQAGSTGFLGALAAASVYSAAGKF